VKGRQFAERARAPQHIAAVVWRKAAAMLADGGERFNPPGNGRTAIFAMESLREGLFAKAQPGILKAGKEVVVPFEGAAGRAARVVEKFFKSSKSAKRTRVGELSGESLVTELDCGPVGRFGLLLPAYFAALF